MHTGRACSASGLQQNMVINKSTGVGLVLPMACSRRTNNGARVCFANGLQQNVNIDKTIGVRLVLPLACSRILSSTVLLLLLLSLIMSLFVIMINSAVNDAQTEQALSSSRSIHGPHFATEGQCCTKFHLQCCTMLPQPVTCCSAHELAYYALLYCEGMAILLRWVLAAALYV